MAKEKICGIYMIKNLINGKVYIGQSKDIMSRWATHLSDFKNQKHNNIYFQRSWNKYGKNNYKFSVIKECDVSELNKYEAEYIKFYNSCNQNNGYNLTEGGDSNIVYSDSLIKHMRDVQKSIPIVQLDFNGKLIKTWKHGCREASKELDISQSHIWECINKNNISCKDCFWITEQDYEENNYDLEILQNNKLYKVILQYDLEGNLIKEWDSIKEIREDTNLNSNIILNCCRKVTKNYNEFIWKYKNDKTIDIIQRKPKVIRKDLNGIILQEFNSVLKASKTMQLNIRSLYDCLSKKTKTCGGFKWEYKSQEIIEL